jgi:hypothetical protein
MTLPSWSLKNSSLRLLAVVAIVLAVHLLLLKGVTGLQLWNEHKHESHKVSIRLLPGEDATLADFPKAQEQSQQEEVPVSTVGTAPAEQPHKEAQQNIKNSGSTQRDDQLSLDFQLADIQGSTVKLGELNLSLLVRAGKYESAQRWSSGEEHFQSSSEGVVDAILRPRSFTGDAENTSRVAIPEGTQDQLSIVWNLRNMALRVMSKTPPDYEKTWDVSVLMGSVAYPMHWTFESMDNLLLPAGRFRAAKAVGTTDPGGLARIRIWYAVDFDFFPIRMEIRDAVGRIQDAKISTLLEKAVPSIGN